MFTQKHNILCILRQYCCLNSGLVKGDCTPAEGWRYWHVSFSTDPAWDHLKKIIGSSLNLCSFGLCGLISSLNSCHCSVSQDFTYSSLPSVSSIFSLMLEVFSLHFQCVDSWSPGCDFDCTQGMPRDRKSPIYGSVIKMFSLIVFITIHLVFTLTLSYPLPPAALKTGISQETHLTDSFVQSFLYTELRYRLNFHCDFCLPIIALGQFSFLPSISNILNACILDLLMTVLSNRWSTTGSSYFG